MSTTISQKQHLTSPVGHVVILLLLAFSSISSALAQMIPEAGGGPAPPPGVAPPYATPPEPFPTPGVLPNGGIGLGNPFAPIGQNPLGGTAPNDSYAASRQFTAGQGDPGTINGMTEGNWYGNSNHTSFQNAAKLPTTSSMPFTEYGSKVAPGNLALMNQGWVSLPPTNLDSFVYQSGMDPLIYGDEGTFGPPPYFGFNFPNTIGQGIDDSQDSATLTTGHASTLPSSWLWTISP